MDANFRNFDHSKIFPGATWGPTLNLCLIGSSGLTFIGFKHPNRHQDKQSIYLYFFSGLGLEWKPDKNLVSK